VLEYDSKSSGAEAYRSLAAELAMRLQSGSSPTPIAEAEIEGDPVKKSWSLKSLFAREKEKGRKRA
jgi:hypothetical protein